MVTQRFGARRAGLRRAAARGEGAAVGQAGTSASVGVGPPAGFPPPSTTRVKQGKPPKAPTPKQVREGGGRILQFAVPSPGPGGPPSLAQLISPGGAVVTDPDSQYRIPVSTGDRELAANGGDTTLTDVSSQGTDLRVLTQPLANGGAIQVRPLPGGHEPHAQHADHHPGGG